MSEDVKVSLGKAGTVLGVLVLIATFAGAWFVIPYRVEAAEKRIEQLETEARTARELLVRIDENVKALKERAVK